MKKFFTLITAIGCFSSMASAQLLVEDFNFSGLLTSNGWAQTALEAGDPISTTTGLTYPGYQGSGIGNAANVTGTLQDVNRGFAKQTIDGSSVWMSALINVTEATNISGNGVNVLHMGDRSDTDPSSFSNFAARVYIKANATGVSIGASNTSSSFYGTTVFQRNTTYLIVVKYTINVATPDGLKLWVFPAGVPATEADLGTPEVDNPGTGQDEIDAVAIRQAPSLPDVIIDGIRVTNAYQQISLPLNLTSFSGSLNEKAVKLNWTSTNEENVRAFAIERSGNGRDFSIIDNVVAKNTNRAAYSFLDNAPLEGTSFYRLRMIDRDGAVKLSAVVAINNRRAVSIRVFPNPTRGNLNISHPKTGSRAAFRVLSVDGRQVKLVAVEQGALQTNISLSDLLKGDYLLQFENNGEKTITKFSKQ